MVTGSASPETKAFRPVPPSVHPSATMGRPPQLTDDYQSATPSPTLPTAVTAWVALQPTAPPPSPANDPGVCDDDGVGPLTPRSCGVEELEPPKSR